MRTLAIPVTERQVLDACSAASAAERNYGTQACIAGMLLIEYQQAIFAQNPNKSPIRHDVVMGRALCKTEDQSWLTWLEKKARIHPRTAQRWMQAAEAVARLQLRRSTAYDFLPYIDVEGTPVALSQALTAPEEGLPEQARKFRQGFFDFIGHKTLGEAVRAAVDGESPAHRITRAGTGKLCPGAGGGGNRKAWGVFIRDKFQAVLSHWKHWQAFTPDQQDESLRAIDGLLAGAPPEVLTRFVKSGKAELRKRL